MKCILFIGNNIGDPGGGERSLLQIKGIAEDKWKCETEAIFIDKEEVQSAEFEVFDILPKKILNFSTYEIRMFLRYVVPLLRKSEVENKINEIDPDLIIAQTQASYIAARIGSEKEIPVKTLIRANELLYKDFFHGKNILTKILNGVPAFLNSKFAKFALANSEKIVANSKHTASKYSQRYPEIEDKMEVMYPLAEKSKYDVDSTGDKIVHVNPIEPKGIDITLEVAENMPEREFLIVGNEGPQHLMNEIENLPNVEFGGFYEDMKSVYRQAGIVLFPSREEAFGRISVEAGYSGIPVITSGVGGLSESMSVQKLNVKNNTPEDYISKIKEVENNYEEYSELSRENAEKLYKESLESMKTVLGLEN